MGQAVGLTFSEDGTEMFVWERDGSSWVVKNNQKQLMIDISEEVLGFHDHGMLGFALHPQFNLNGYFYLFYLVDRHHLINYGTPAYNPTITIMPGRRLADSHDTLQLRRHRLYRRSCHPENYSRSNKINGNTINQ